MPRADRPADHFAARAAAGCSCAAANSFNPFSSIITRRMLCARPVAGSTTTILEFAGPNGKPLYRVTSNRLP